MNYKVMWVFAKTRFDVVLHTRNPGTGKIFHTGILEFSSECERSYHLTCFIMLSPRIIAFFVCSGVSSFHAVALGRLIPSFIDNCICLVWSWCTWIVTTFIFFTDFISWITINVCSYNIITICVVINCPFISLKIFLAVFNWFCNFFYWFKWIIYFCT